MTKDAASEARNATHAATSSARPTRPRGVSSARAARSSGVSSAFISVSMVPGDTQLTRMPLGPTYCARAFVNPMTAAFDAEYAASQLAPVSPHMEDRFTMLPVFREIIPGSAARIIR